MLLGPSSKLYMRNFSNGTLHRSALRSEKEKGPNFFLFGESRKAIELELPLLLQSLTAVVAHPDWNTSVNTPGQTADGPITSQFVVYKVRRL